MISLVNGVVKGAKTSCMAILDSLIGVDGFPLTSSTEGLLWQATVLGASSLFLFLPMFEMSVRHWASYAFSSY